MNRWKVTPYIVWRCLAAVLLLLCLLLGPFRVDDGYADTCIPSAAFGNNVWTSHYTRDGCSDRVRIWTKDELFAIACAGPDYWNSATLLIDLPRFSFRTLTGLDAMIVLDVIAPERLYPCGAHMSGCSVPVLVCSTFDRIQLTLQCLQLLLTIGLLTQWITALVRRRSLADDPVG